MRDKIVELVQKNNVMAFEEMLSELKKTFPELTPSTLAQNIRSLSAEDKIISASRNLYNPQSLPTKQGFIHWNVNQLCWLEETDKTNDFGIAFNGEEGLLNIINKSEALYGGYADGYIITDPETEKQSFYLKKVLKMKPVTLFVAYDSKESSWVILNSNVGMTIHTSAFSANGKQHGDVMKLNSVDFKAHENFGNMADKDIEGQIIQALAGITEAPQVEIDDKLMDKPLPFDASAFYTIDSLSTKDIDDAIYCEKRNDGGYTLKVAIADVSTFVTPGSELDKHAAQACTSFYFYNHTVHMLSRALAEKYCSLNVGENRNSMIATLEMDSEGKTQSVIFENKKIQSNARLTYDDVNRFLNGEPMLESFQASEGMVKPYVKHEAVEKSLQALQELSKKLQVPYNPTYWFVPTPELEIGEDGKVSSLYFEQRNTSASQIMVETAMLSANKAAAKFLHENNVNAKALFRNQTAPADDLERPKPAQYGSDNSGHWGLQAEFYTQFTSPIRRYCDLTVHRMIKAVLNKENTADMTAQLDAVAAQINAQQYKSRICNNRETSLLMNQYLEKLVSTKEFHVKHQIVDFSERGVVFRNSQLIETFLPLFKTDRNLQNQIKALTQTELNPSDKTQAIAKLNDDFKFKCFLDRYNQLSDYKDITFKMYAKDAEELKAASPNKLNRLAGKFAK